MFTKVEHCAECLAWGKCMKCGEGIALSLARAGDDDYLEARCDCGYENSFHKNNLNAVKKL